MHHFLKDLLICPECHGSLSWRIEESTPSRIETAEARCDDCGALYPVRDGVGLFLTPDLPRNDMWEQVESGLSRYLADNPDVRKQLMDNPLDDLEPADRFFRAMILEEEGQYEKSKSLMEAVEPLLYTDAYWRATEGQIQAILDYLSDKQEPVIDLASGRGTLVGRCLEQIDRPIVATDFSPRVLRRNQQWFGHFGLAERLSQLAFDVRRTPFRDRSLPVMTTYMGLANVEDPGDVLLELNRISAGVFLIATIFYPEDDQPNGVVLKETGLDELMYQRRFLAALRTAGWKVETILSEQGSAVPTPKSRLLGGIGIDGLPVAETTLTWSVLAAEPTATI